MMTRYGGHPVLFETGHLLALAKTVLELAKASLLDLTPFVPTKPNLP